MKVRHPLILASVAALGLALRAGPPPSDTAAAAVTAADPPPNASAKPGGAAEVATPTFEYRKDVLPFLTAHCFACHGNGKHKADQSFDRFTDDPSVLADRKLWEGVRRMIADHEMPPEGKPRPGPGEIDAVTAAIGGMFDAHDRKAGPVAGRVTLRRLNRTEYNNTVRDLLGIDFKPADDFPADDVGYGFDNIGDVLSVTPLLLEKYLGAAEQILEQAIVVAEPPKPSRSKVGAVRTNAASTPFEMGGTVAFDEGDYVVRARVTADQVGDEPARATLRVAGADAGEFAVTATPRSGPQVVEARVRMKAGTSRVGVVLANPFSLPDPASKPASQPTSPPATQPGTRPAAPAVAGVGNGFAGRRFRPPVPVNDGRTRILYLEGIEVEGPFDPPPPPVPDSQKRLLAHADGVSPREAAREIVTRFAGRAFRRPAKPDEVERCLALFDASAKQGKRFELCVRAALYRVLLSPHFLFRVELDPPGVAEGKNYPIGEYELASRLSYFLWNSMPDDELFALAAKGELRANLDAQVRRMVKDTKSASFVYGFADQWLALRKLDLASPDPKLFPTFDPNLRRSMARESELFFEAVVREDKGVPALLDADFTFVDESLAKHYGVAGVTGKDFVRVPAPPGRGGVLTQAAVLTLTSNATRTSPVKRGSSCSTRSSARPRRPRRLTCRPWRSRSS